MDVRGRIDEDGRVLTDERQSAAVVVPVAPPGRGGLRRAWARIEPLLPLLRALAFGVAVVIVVVMGVRAVRVVDFHKLSLWPLPIAFVCAAAWWLLLARGWALLVTGGSRRSDIAVWCQTQAIRYLPGGIWAPASRVTLLPGTVADKLTTVGAENVIALCAALAVGGVAFAAGGRLIWLPLVLVLAAPLIAVRFVAARSRVTIERALHVTWNDAIGFVAYAAAAVLVQAAVSGRFDPASVAGAAAIAWAAGLVVVIAPSGLGVREVVYVALASGTVSTGQATTAAITLRLVTVFAELLVLVSLGRPTTATETPPAE